MVLLLEEARILYVCRRKEEHHDVSDLVAFAVVMVAAELVYLADFLASLLVGERHLYHGFGEFGLLHVESLLHNLGAFCVGECA